MDALLSSKNQKNMR